MRFLYLILCSLFISSWSYTQTTFKITGGKVKAADGSYLTLQNAGFANNSGSPLEVGGNVVLRGNAASATIGGTAPYTIFKSLTVNKSSGEVQLGSHITIADGLMNVLSGDVNLNGYIITLGPTAAISETPGNTVKGAAGYIVATRGLNAPAADNVAGMGLEITSAANLGHVEVVRGHGAQSAGGSTSILRYFEVSPEFNTGLGASIVFHYDGSELNGQAEGQLKLFQSDDGGASWTLLSGAVNTSANTVSATGLEHLSRFTLSAECLEATLQAVCQDITVQLDANGSASITAADIDGGSTGACGQLSLSASPTSFSCAEVGAANVTLTAMGGVGAESTCTATVTIEDNAGACNQVVCVDAAISNLIVYIEGLGLNGSLERAITRRLELASNRLCSGAVVSVVVSSLESVIDYVAYRSGNGIPPAAADDIIAEIQDMADALNAGTGECCAAAAFSLAAGDLGLSEVERAYHLEVFPNPFTNQATIRFYLPQPGTASLEVFNLQG
ncbi:MAG: hypothetical protein KDD06_28125, partial [Phaeodactylibacter sp.]|nr:hypothetical protein [Phaeodactylibacter sp.]